MRFCLVSLSPSVNKNMLLMAKSRKNITAALQWMTLEMFTGIWKNPTVFSASEHSQGNMTIIRPNMPDIVVTSSSRQS